MDLGAAVYLRADIGVTTVAGLATQWVDRVASHTVSQAVVADRPAAGVDGSSQPYLRFDGASDHLFNGAIPELADQFSADQGIHYFIRTSVASLAAPFALASFGLDTDSWAASNLQILGSTPALGVQRSLYYNVAGSVVRDADGNSAMPINTIITLEGSLRGAPDSDGQFWIDGVHDIDPSDGWGGTPTAPQFNTFSVGNRRGGINAGGLFYPGDIYAFVAFQGLCPDPPLVRAELAALAS